MMQYILMAALGATAIGGGYGYFQHKANVALQVELASQRGELKTCGNRLNNLLEDLKSDHAIDNLPDSALTTVPPHWLRPEGSNP